jgi:hypothetical protein
LLLVEGICSVPGLHTIQEFHSDSLASWAAGPALGGHRLLDRVTSSSCYEEPGHEIPRMAIEQSPVG